MMPKTTPNVTSMNATTPAEAQMMAVAVLSLSFEPPSPPPPPPFSPINIVVGRSVMVDVGAGTMVVKKAAVLVTGISV